VAILFPTLRQMVDDAMGLVLPPKAYRPVGLGAVEFLIKHLYSCIDNQDMLALGPRTNLAELLLTRPDLVHSIDRLYVMGGC
jgi:pyrimidine-specific ribonucleoside hydrolase